MDIKHGIQMGNLSEVKNQMNKDEEAMWNRLKEPAPIVDKDGTQRWFNNAGELHRENDMPAVIWADGSKSWFKNRKRHRDNDLPALVRADGTKEWWITGKFVRNEEPDE